MKRISDIVGWLLGLTILAGLPAYGYEPQIKIDSPAATVSPARDGTYQITKLDDGAKLSGKTGIVVFLPVYLKTEACASDQWIMLFRASATSAAASGDVLGREAMSVWLNPAAREIKLKYSDRPIIEGFRSPSAFQYDFPVLDLIPMERMCTAGGRVNIGIYFNPGNAFVTVRALGAPLANTYSSPVNAGVGSTIMNGILNGSLSISGTLGSGWPVNPPQVTLGGLYWWKDAAIAVSGSNLTDDINLNYGAKAYPVRSPMLDRGSAAASIMSVIIN